MSGMRRAIAILALVSACSGVAQARRVQAHFLLDGTLGVAIPIADDNFTRAFLPSPKFGLHLGVELWFSRHFGLAPELSLDGGPFLERAISSVSEGNFRFQPGLRVLFGFGRGHAFFLRFLLGGEALVFGPGGTQGAGQINLGLGVQPGLGMQFRFSRRGVAGFTLDFPIGVHTFGTPVNVIDATFDIAGFIGLRV